jgi:hypothetical protein
MLHVKYVHDWDVTPASRHLLFQTDFDFGSEVINHNNIQVIVILRKYIKSTNTNTLHQIFPIADLTRFHWKKILYESTTKQNYTLWVCCHVNEHAR